ncbi:polysaccharide biosynthesis protein [Butyribacter intestini]|jgi:stage V sporulation protein B|uniref:polysaccharide biosynthesis protein n=1 Tax=Butyribacter intestini TaxID=1703332 RepID=UPI0022E635F8|nr:polysaccharide biosynthesis protein [Butyribacter intestini]
MNSAAKTKKKVKNKLKSNIIKGTLILSCASILSRIIGFIYRIYLADILGEQLLGTYQLIFPIYVLCFTIYGAGMQSAISQVVATLIGKNNTHSKDDGLKGSVSKDRSLKNSNLKYRSSKNGNFKDNTSKNNNKSSLVKGNYPFVSSAARNITPRTILLAGTILSFILALFLSIFINFNSKWIACNILMVPDCDIYLKLLTYLFPFCSISACICGYQYGLENAKPPAIAGIIEQITRILFVFIVQGFFSDKEICCQIAVYGLTVGEFFGFLYNMSTIKNKKRNNKKHISDKNLNNDNAKLHSESLHSKRQHAYNAKSDNQQFKRQELKNKTFNKRKNKISLKESFKLLLPVFISLTSIKLTISLLHSVESIFIPASLVKYGYTMNEALSVYGIYSGMAMPFIMFPATITMAISTMLLPAVSKAHSSGNKKQIKKLIRRTSYFCLVTGMAATVFFLLFGNICASLFFHNEIAGRYLTVMSFLCPFLYLNMTYSSILNGLGKPHMTFVITVVCTLIKILSLMFFVPRYGMIAYIAASLIAEALLCVMLRHYCG